MFGWAYDLVVGLIDWGGYFGVYLLALLETVFPPIPSEVVLPIAGMRAASGPLGLPGVIVAGTLGSMTGNVLWFLLARWVSEHGLRRFVERHGRWLTMDWRDVEKAQLLFDRHGGGIVFTARLLPAVRTFVSIPAGIAHMPFGRFLAWSTAGTLIFCAAFTSAGYLAGSNVARIEEIMRPVTAIIVGGIILWYCWRQLTWKRRTG
jgi:membrane protein DedA with SNARE-associated domain